MLSEDAFSEEMKRRNINVGRRHRFVSSLLTEARNGHLSTRCTCIDLPSAISILIGKCTRL